MNSHKTHPIPKLAEDQLTYYSLPGLLPAGHRLAFHPRLGILSRLAPGEDGQPCLLVQEQFAVQEARVLLPLLDNFPHYCPHEVLFASFYGGAVTEQAVARARERLQEAREAGVFDYELRPVRNVLSRMRVKLHAFGIDARSILETGYLLKPQEVPAAQDEERAHLMPQARETRKEHLA